jgi:ABC-type phosphate transport system substrate-binding protein
VSRRSFPAPPTLVRAAVLAALAACAISAPAHAGSPGGTSCAPDGRIAGRGDSFGAPAQTNVLIPGFCNGQQLVYGYPGGAVGSDQALLAASCRTDVFAQSGYPYDAAGLAALRGAPGSIAPCPADSTSPFPPNSPPFPAPTDTAAPLLTIPIAATTVGLTSNLSGCQAVGGPPLQLTGPMVSLLFSGLVTSWSDRRLRRKGANPWLAGCHLPVTRVVRSDSAGATSVLKDYLVTVDPTRLLPGPAGVGTLDPCTWPSCYNAAGAQRNWPGGDLLTPVSGDTAVASEVLATPGAIGYVEPGQVSAAGLRYASVKAIKGGTMQQPLVATPGGTGANVDLSAAHLPAGDPLGTGADSWASAASGMSHVNVVGGHAYPIQGLILLLAYPLATFPDAISRATLDQRQTLFDYVHHALSPGAQTSLGGAFYAPLPAAWRTALLGAFDTDY